MDRKYIEGFYQSEIPPRDSDINTALIKNMAKSTKPLPEINLRRMLAQHRVFISTGGAGGRFERMHIAGVPMNIYLKAAKEGQQFELRLKHIAANTNLKNAEITYGDFSGCFAEEVNFENANLDYSLMTDCFLAGSNFDNCSAVGVDFTGTDLTGVSFENADLRYADFEIANCMGVNFTGANIENAIFKGTNLDGIKR